LRTANAGLGEIHETMEFASIRSVLSPLRCVGNTDTSPSASVFGAFQGLGVKLVKVLFKQGERWVTWEEFSVPERRGTEFLYRRYKRITATVQYVWALFVYTADTAFVEDPTLD
jgi:hypothetical protein